MREPVRKCATWPQAWTPASVRPEPMIRTASPHTFASALSISPCTVRCPGWACQPRKFAPSYSIQRTRQRRLPAAIGAEG